MHNFLQALSLTERPHQLKEGPLLHARCSLGGLFSISLWWPLRRPLSRSAFMKRPLKQTLDCWLDGYCWLNQSGILATFEFSKSFVSFSLQGWKMEGWTARVHWADCTDLIVPAAALPHLPMVLRRWSCLIPWPPPSPESATSNTTWSRTTAPGGSTSARCARRWVPPMFIGYRSLSQSFSWEIS